MPPPNLPSVELLPAFLFVCPDCGLDNFVRCRRIEPDSDEGRELTEQLDNDTEIVWRNVGGDWLEAPTEVACAYCGTKFPTTFIGATDNQEF
jgi:hypothetical protein